jgi:hypothetical protein
MKKLTLLLAFGILALTSCTKEDSVPNGSTPASGTFSVNGKVYKTDRSFIITNQVSMYSGGNVFSVVYGNDTTLFYNVVINESNGMGNVGKIYYGYYISKNPLKFYAYSDKSNIKTTKNANGTYTVKGTIYMYEDFDSTKRVTVGANFTTF